MNLNPKLYKKSYSKEEMMSCVENSARNCATDIIATEAWRYVVERLGVKTEGGWWHDKLVEKWVKSAKTLKRLESPKYDVEQYKPLVEEAVLAVKRSAEYIVRMTHWLEAEMAFSEVYEDEEAIKKIQRKTIDNLYDAYRNAVNTI